MRIKLASVFVCDQEKALQFYTKVLGLAKKADIPTGKHRWLTVVSPEGPGEIELLLEPMGFDLVWQPDSNCASVKQRRAWY